MLYEIHMLKNYPPVNLNRDESGAPKSCMFGGTTRGRVSSQCLKRSWRISPLFSQAVGAEHLGIRTRQLRQGAGEKLAELGVSQEYIDAVFQKISGFGNKDGKTYLTRAVAQSRISHQQKSGEGGENGEKIARSGA